MECCRKCPRMSDETFTFIDNIIVEHPVVAFTTTTCPYCIKAKELLKALNLEYYAVDIDLLSDKGKSVKEALLKKTGQSTVPNIFIKGRHIGGFDDLRKAQADFSLFEMMDGTHRQRDYDVIVLGGGSGGVAAAKQASECGMKVAVCDFVSPTPRGTTWGLGGTCVNVGCVPKKLMHESALLGDKLREDAGSFGWDVQSKQHDWDKLIENTQSYIKQLNFVYRKTLRSMDITYFNATGEFVGQHEIKVTNKKGEISQCTAQTFIIATGGRPKYLDIPGAKEFGITSDDLFSLEHPPGNTLIVGASYIAVECAGILSGLGMNVTIMVREVLLRHFDRFMAELIEKHLASQGIKFHYGFILESIERVVDGDPPSLKVTAISTTSEEKISEIYNTVLFAIGRKANTINLGLDIVGVKLNADNGKVYVNENDQTNIKYIYAIGDVADGRPELTPVAIQAGVLLAERLCVKHDILMNYTNIPTTVFSPIEYGFVGLSEEEAIEKYSEDDIEVYHSYFLPLEYVMTYREDLERKSYAKLICVKSMDELVVGIHYYGPVAGEVIQGFAISLKLNARKSDFSNLTGIHPTCAEIFTSLKITKSSGINVEKTLC